MSSFELDPDEMREARKRLGDHLTLLTQYRNLAHDLAQPLHDGNNPVAKQMRKAYLDRADTEGGVQAVLDDYIAELTDIVTTIDATLSTYDALDGDRAAAVRRSGEM